MNIIVTGASRGIGKALVSILAQEERVNNILILSRNEVNHESSKVRSISFDLNNPDFDPVRNWIDEVGNLFCLVNNAGQLVNKPFDQTDASDWKQMMKVNVIGPAILIQHLLPHFEDQNAHIVNISSMGGYQGTSKFPGLAAYSASKAALNCMTEVLAEELKERGVHCNALALGAVNTEMLEEAFPGYVADTNADEMAQFISSFVLDQWKSFNGKILPVSSSTP